MEAKKKIDYVYIIIVILTTCGLIALLYLINTKIISVDVIEKQIEELDKSTSTTTTTVVANETDTIIVNNENVVINVKTYNSHFGFSLKYDKDYFDAVTLSDSSVEFKCKNDASYFKISKINETIYNEEFINDGIISIEDNIQLYVTYKILGNNYFKIVYSIDKNIYIDDTLESRFNYMILSLEKH